MLSVLPPLVFKTVPRGTLCSAQEVEGLGFGPRSLHHFPNTGAPPTFSPPRTARSSRVRTTSTLVCLQTRAEYSNQSTPGFCTSADKDPNSQDTSCFQSSSLPKAATCPQPRPVSTLLKLRVEISSMSYRKVTTRWQQRPRYRPRYSWGVPLPPGICPGLSVHEQR